MASIFISYNRKSAPITKAIAEDIEAIGHTVWYDDDLSGGQAWWDQILAKVRSCDIFVFVLDTEALNSTACIREYGYADELGKPILPILGADGVSLNILPSALSNIQFVDYRTQDRSTAFKLARALLAIPPAKPLPTTLPAPPQVPVSYLGGLSSKVDTTSTLTYEEQSALVLDLQRGLVDNESFDDTRILLKRLRKRRDLYAAIADNIDELLGRLKSVNQTVSKTVISPNEKKDGKEQIQPDNNTKGADTIEMKTGDTIHKSRSYRKPSPGLRIKGALILALIGTIGGVLLYYLRFRGNYSLMVISPVICGGIIAGFISGTNRFTMFGGIIGICIVLYLLGPYVHPYSIVGKIFAICFPLVGAVIGMLIENKKRQKE